jgi:Pentapeptide repeats (8 copies)
VGAFHTQLEAQIPDPHVRAQLRRQLPSNIFVQMLAGPREVRRTIIGVMLRLIARISLVLGPLALLVFFQVQFLPYHPHWGVGLWQRGAVIVDLALLWILWPAISRGRVRWIGWRDISRARAVPIALVGWLRTLWRLPWVAPYNKPVYNKWRSLRAAWRRTIFAAAITSLIPIILVFTISTYPDEWLNRSFESVPIIKSLHQLLFAGKPDEVTERPSSWFSNRLVLTDQSFVDPEKLEKETVSHSFRGRDLNYAVLSRTDLRKADFTGAKLYNIRLCLKRRSFRMRASVV